MAPSPDVSPTSAPIDFGAVAPALDPGTTGCMLPAAAYLDEEVLAGDRTSPVRRRVGVRRPLQRAHPHP
jgi:hypothetical protein